MALTSSLAHFPARLPRIAALASSLACGIGNLCSPPRFAGPLCPSARRIPLRLASSSAAAAAAGGEHQPTKQSTQPADSTSKAPRHQDWIQPNSHRCLSSRGTRVSERDRRRKDERQSHSQILSEAGLRHSSPSSPILSSVLASHRRTRRLPACPPILPSTSFPRRCIIPLSKVDCIVRFLNLRVISSLPLTSSSALHNEGRID